MKCRFKLRGHEQHFLLKRNTKILRFDGNKIYAWPRITIFYFLRKHRIFNPSFHLIQIKNDLEKKTSILCWPYFYSMMKTKNNEWNVFSKALIVNLPLNLATSPSFYTIFRVLGIGYHPPSPLSGLNDCICKSVKQSKLFIISQFLFWWCHIESTLVLC